MADAGTRVNEPDAAEARLIRLLNMILEAAVEALGFDAATVTARHGDDVATIAATDQRMIALDDAQYATGDGPCLEVLEPHEPVPVGDAATSHERWQNFARTAAHLDVHSTLSVHLPVDSEGLAASLNLYSRRYMDLSAEQARRAAPFAEQLASAIIGVDAYRSTARLARNLAEAMHTRAVIEQAKGILMAQQRIDADAAFRQLARVSQDTNTKLHDVARRLVERTSEA